ADLALALTLDARSVLRPDLRVLAMSATLETARVAALIGAAGDPSDDGGHLPAPVITSASRSHRVEVRWRPTTGRQRPADVVPAVVSEALRSDPGDVLVFLAGAADIRRVASTLERAVPHDV